MSIPEVFTGFLGLQMEVLQIEKARPVCCAFFDPIYRLAFLRG
jgi:hypothetical protein